VIRNRIALINDEDDPSLFGADEDDYDSDPIGSYYDVVIYAPDQFSPTGTDDPTYDTFIEAEDRDLLSGNWLIAYDQAVLTAGRVFNGDISDTTGNCFAFRSPTAAEWDLIAGNLGADEIPEGSGFTDESFPSLDPIQIVILPDIWAYDGGMPSFVFAREREDGAAAITNSP